jgi:hypothetical protein
MSTAYKTLGGAIGCCIISSNRLVTTTYAPDGSWRKTLRTTEIWLMRITESIQIGHGSMGIKSRADVRRTPKQFRYSSVLCYLIFLSSLVIRFRLGIHRVGMGFTTYQSRWSLTMHRIFSKVAIISTHTLWDS